MYVRVLNFVCRANTETSDIRRIYRLIADEAGNSDGFIGSTLLMRENACLGMALMYWRDEHSAAEAGPAIVELLGEHAHSLLDNAPEIEGYYVIENGILPDGNHA